LPILFIHGVANRDPQQFAKAIEPRLRKFVAPLLAGDPDSVWIDQAFWGDLGATFAFGGASRPPTELLGQGAGEFSPVTALGLALTMKAGAPQSELTSGKGGGAVTLTVDFDGMPLEQKVLLIYQVISDEPYPGDGSLILRIEGVLQSEAGKAKALAASTVEAKVQAIALLLRQDGAIAGMGGGGWLEKIGDRVKATLSGWTLSALRPVGDLLGEIRPGANDLIIRFFGDIFEYLGSRSVWVDEVQADGTTKAVEKPGPIITRVLDKLKEAHKISKAKGEKLIVMTHSMGGQLLYEAVTYYADLDPELADLKVHFWATAASQVALFEELRLFKVSATNTGPAHRPTQPARVDYWWNVWDQDDWLSYTAAKVFAPVMDWENHIKGIDDERYDGKLPFPWSHSGYPNQDQFYKMMVQRIRKS